MQLLSVCERVVSSVFRWRKAGYGPTKLTDLIVVDQSIANTLIGVARRGLSSIIELLLKLCRVYMRFTLRNKRLSCLLWVLTIHRILLIAYKNHWQVPEIFRYAVSKVLAGTAYKSSVNAETVRSGFRDLAESKLRPADVHTHANSASDRSAAAIFAERVANNIGSVPYYMSKSRADERNNRLGSRSYYWAKDLSAQVEKFELPDNAMLSLIDVDQYLDMPHMLSKHAIPTFIYTFQPHAVARCTPEYSFTSDEQNVFTYRVSGGASYTHMVWNYSMDNMLAVSYFLGIPYRATAYLVDRRNTQPDHEMIMLTPLMSWNFFTAWLVPLSLESTVLERLNVHQGNGFNRMFIQKQGEGMLVSTGVVNNYNSAVISKAVDETLLLLAKTSKYDIQLPTIQGYVKDRDVAAILLGYYRSGIIDVKPPVVCPVDVAIRSYQFKPARYDPNAKPGMVAFMSPLLNNAFVPDQSINNEEQCVEGRIERVRPRELVVTPFLHNVIQEFATLLIPEQHQLHPTTVDEVIERQSRPSQRMILYRTFADLPERVIKMFVKKESYGNVKDPRPISTVNGPDKRDYSTITYAFEKLLKQTPWYAFSQSPKSIATRVSKVCQEATSHVITSDFSRFDGHGSNLMRELERVLLLRAFHPQYHQEICDLHRSQYGLLGHGRLGTKYDMGYSRASGSPETSIFNSTVNAFVAFLAFRRTSVSGVYYTASEAWNRLGVYGGDDGLTGDLDKDTYVRSAEMIGQELAAEPIKRGDFGVKFLARIYSPDVWTGDLNSCCDLKRQLSKIHVTVHMDSFVTPQQKLREKAMAYVLTDKNTPIIGPFCRTAVRLLKDVKVSEEQMKNLQRITPWLAQFEADVQYPNEPAEWMEDYAGNLFPSFNHTAFDHWLANANQETILKPSMIAEQDRAMSQVPVVIDGDILPFELSLLDNKERDNKAITSGFRQNPVVGSDRRYEGKYSDLVENYMRYDQIFPVRERDEAVPRPPNADRPEMDQAREAKHMSTDNKRSQLGEAPRNALGTALGEYAILFQISEISEESGDFRDECDPEVSEGEKLPTPLELVQCVNLQSKLRHGTSYTPPGMRWVPRNSRD